MKTKRKNETQKRKKHAGSLRFCKTQIAESESYYKQMTCLHNL